MVLAGGQERKPFLKISSILGYILYRVIGNWRMISWMSTKVMRPFVIQGPNKSQKKVV